MDIVVYDPKSKHVHAICEVKSTAVLQEKEFQLNGVGPVILASAYHPGIPTFLVVVRLKNKPPESIHTKVGLGQYDKYLRENPSEYYIEFYAETEFELRGIKDDRVVIKDVQPVAKKTGR